MGLCGSNCRRNKDEQDGSVTLSRDVELLQADHRSDGPETEYPDVPDDSAGYTAGYAGNEPPSPQVEDYNFDFMEVRGSGQDCFDGIYKSDGLLKPSKFSWRTLSQESRKGSRRRPDGLGTGWWPMWKHEHYNSWIRRELPTGGDGWVVCASRANMTAGVLYFKDPEMRRLVPPVSGWHEHDPHLNLELKSDVRLEWVGVDDAEKTQRGNLGVLGYWAEDIEALDDEERHDIIDHEITNGQMFREYKNLKDIQTRLEGRGPQITKDEFREWSRQISESLLLAMPKQLTTDVTYLLNNHPMNEAFVV